MRCREFFGVERIFDPFLAERPFRLAAETVHALRHVGLKADAALLAVVGDVDAGPALLLHHVGDALVDFFGELGLIDRLASLFGDQQVVEFGAARQAAGMRGQDVVGTLVHEVLPLTFSLLGRQRCIGDYASPVLRRAR